MNEQLLKAFAASGLSAYRLAKDIGVSTSTIYRWLEGGELKLETFELIADQLGFFLARRRS